MLIKSNGFTHVASKNCHVRTHVSQLASARACHSAQCAVEMSCYVDCIRFFFIFSAIGVKSSAPKRKQNCVLMVDDELQCVHSRMGNVNIKKVMRINTDLHVITNL